MDNPKHLKILKIAYNSIHIHVLKITQKPTFNRYFSQSLASNTL